MQASLLDTDQFGQTSAGGARAKPVLRAEPSAGSIQLAELVGRMAGEGGLREKLLLHGLGGSC